MPSELVILKKDKEALEQQLQVQKKATYATEEQNEKLKNQLFALECMLAEKKSRIESIEFTLEQLGIDPVKMSKFTFTEEAIQGICTLFFKNFMKMKFFVASKSQEVLFENRMKELKFGIENRKELLRECMGHLQEIQLNLSELERR